VVPIDQHDWFIRSGRMMAALGSVVTRYDLPEVLTLPGNRPVLFAGNHRSLLDLVVTMAVFTRFGLSSSILVREDFVNSGLGGRYLRSIGCIATSKQRAREAELEAVSALRSGHLVSMMPEGRLNAPSSWVNGVGPGRPGVSRIAVAADAVVVPIGFIGTERVWPRGKPPRIRVPRRGVTLRVGSAIEMESTDHQVNADRVMAAISDLVLPGDSR